EAGAAEEDPEWYAALLLAGDAGLRRGEILALEKSDLNFHAKNLVVRRNDWKGILGAPKGGRQRVVPMTGRLMRALQAARHLKGSWILCHLDGTRCKSWELSDPLWRMCERAGLRKVSWH